MHSVEPLSARLLTLLVVATSGCGGDSGASAGAAPAATFTEIYAELFPSETGPRCNFCHSMPASDTSNGKLSVGSDQASAYAALVGMTSASSHCGGMPLVEPNEPDMSLFLLKLTGEVPCGSRMPIGGAHLSDAQVEKIRSWISAGAKND